MARALTTGDTDLAFRYARAVNPFASSCGHGCHAPCERGCRRRYFGAPVAIAALERHASAGDTPHVSAPPGPCTSAYDARPVDGLVGLNPQDAESWSYLAKAYRGAGRTVDAARAQARAAKLDPKTYGSRRTG